MPGREPRDPAPDEPLEDAGRGPARARRRPGRRRGRRPRAPSRRTVTAVRARRRARSAFSNRLTRARPSCCLSDAGRATGHPRPRRSPYARVVGVRPARAGRATGGWTRGRGRPGRAASTDGQVLTHHPASRRPSSSRLLERLLEPLQLGRDEVQRLPAAGRTARRGGARMTSTLATSVVSGERSSWLRSAAKRASRSDPLVEGLDHAVERPHDDRQVGVVGRPAAGCQAAHRDRRGGRRDVVERRPSAGATPPGRAAAPADGGQDGEAPPGRWPAWPACGPARSAGAIS